MPELVEIDESDDLPELVEIDESDEMPKLETIRVVGYKYIESIQSDLNSNSIKNVQSDNVQELNETSKTVGYQYIEDNRELNQGDNSVFNYFNKNKENNLTVDQFSNDLLMKYKKRKNKQR